jgi:signal transduction histidine kinase
LIADIDGDPNKGEETAPPMVQRLIGFSNTMSDDEKPRISTSFRDHKPLEPYVDLIEPASFFTPEEFKTADHHFTGKFDEFGQFNGKVTIYKKDPIDHTIQWTAGKGAPTKCGSFELNLAYVQGKHGESLLAANDWTRITRKLNKIGGLYIYKNGIRVLPYGSSDYDFLELEQQRSKKASTGFFSYRRMFGFVKISSEQNPDLNEKAGREGFRENAAYRDFRAILKNFFAQMATDFFRESGIYAEAYVESKDELQRQNQLRRQRESLAKEARQQFATELDQFFDAVGSGVPTDETSQLLAFINEQIRTTSDNAGTSKLPSELIEIEAVGKDKLNRLRERFEVSKPRGVGLTTALDREWRAYKTEVARVEKEIFEPAEKRIEEQVTSAASLQQSTANSKQLIRAAFEQSTAEIHDTVEHKREQALSETAKLGRQMEQLIQISFETVDEAIRDSKTELSRILKANLPEGAYLGEYYRLKDAVLETAERENRHLDDLIRKLRRAIDISVDPDDVIEALEEENLALVERSEAEVELAQLGMAVSAIGHEFRETVSSIRSNLNRLKGWADVNKDLRDLWRNIRGDFDHLDAYLELFTPLQQRLFRKKVTIKGSGIEDYLKKLFGDRLKREKVELNVSNAFRRMSLEGFPSTFYPVFVNLIDNSLYWLKDRSGRKVINLDMEGGSTFVIADNGPGVPKRDSYAIFERGFTRKPGGRGMGLAISREVLEREGRELVLGEPQPGQGAIFKIKPKPHERRQ